MSKSRNITTKEAAAAVGCSRPTIQRLCRQHNLGEMVGRDRLLTAADVAKLKKLYQGRPGSPGGEVAIEAGRRGGQSKAKKMAKKKARKPKGE